MTRFIVMASPCVRETCNITSGCKFCRGARQKDKKRFEHRNAVSVSTSFHVASSFPVTFSVYVYIVGTSIPLLEQHVAQEVERAGW